MEQLPENEQQKFLAEWKKLVWTENVQATQAILCNIRDVPIIILEGVPPWLMDRLKETIDHYLNGQWLSSIAVTGIIAEWLTFFLLEDHVREKGIAGLIRHSKELGNQYGRLATLKHLRILKTGEYKQLQRVTDHRNQYVHLNVGSDRIRKQAKGDCLDALQNLIEFLNKRFKIRFRWPSSDYTEEDFLPKEDEDEYPFYPSINFPSRANAPQQPRTTKQ